MKITFHQINGYEKIIETTLAGGLKSFIAIHNTNRGPALGGLRFYPFCSEEEALLDVLRLSEAMSYKAALANLALGGGKAVIIGDPSTQKNSDVLLSFAEFINQLEGQYITAKDVGITVDDLDIVATKSQWVTGTSSQTSDPSPMTAYGVFCGMKASLHFKNPQETFLDKKIIIQGLGHVGWEIARHLKNEKAQVYACDVSADRLNLAEKELGIEPIHLNHWNQTSASLFCPCAMGGILNEQSLPLLKKHGITIIAGAANNQLSAPVRDGQICHRAGILYAPDYVINAGGLIQVAGEILGYAQTEAMKKTEGIYETLMTIYQKSKNSKSPTAAIAQQLAVDRIRNQS